MPMQTPTPSTKPVLPAVWDVPQVLRKRLGRQAGRQRAMFSDGHLLLVLHAPPGPDEDERTGRFFWRQPDGTWSSDQFGGGPHALTRHLDEYAAIVDRLEEQDAAASSAEDYFAVLSVLGPIHRAARNMHQTLQQARELVPDAAEIIDFRDRAYAIERRAELLCSDARNALEFDIARRAEEQARTSYKMAVSAHRLNVLAAFFFPLATLSAIFGVNLKCGLEDLPGPVPFLAVLGMGLASGFILKSFVTRDPAWPK